MAKKTSSKVTATSSPTGDSKLVTGQILAEAIKSAAAKKQAQKVKIKLDEGVTLPEYAHDGDLGMDVKATAVEYDFLMDAYIYHTGIYCESKRGLGCFLMPRSSVRKTDVSLANGVGLVETFQYRDEFIFTFKPRESRSEKEEAEALYRWSQLPWYKRIFTRLTDCIVPMTMEVMLDLKPYDVGDKIGQIVWLNFPNVKLEVVDKLSETERGKGGHGSTGK
jgi:dUTP pyrophosphatase